MSILGNINDSGQEPPRWLNAEAAANVYLGSALSKSTDEVVICSTENAFLEYNSTGSIGDPNVCENYPVWQPVEIKRIERISSDRFAVDLLDGKRDAWLGIGDVSPQIPDGTVLQVNPEGGEGNVVNDTGVRVATLQPYTMVRVLRFEPKNEHKTFVQVLTGSRAGLRGNMYAFDLITSSGYDPEYFISVTANGTTYRPSLWTRHP